MNPIIAVFVLETSETNRTSNHTTFNCMYRTNRERIGASRILVVRAIYARTVDFDNIITAYHQLANTLECTGYKAEAAIIEQIISGYERLKNLTAIPNTNPFSDAAGNASATVLEQQGRGVSKAPRLNKDGHLITDYYDLPKPAPHSALPVIIAVIKTPDIYSFSLVYYAVLHPIILTAHETTDEGAVAA